MSELRGITCVAFDAVGTVMFAEPSVARVYAQAAARHGSSLSEDEIRRRFSGAMEVFDRDSLQNNFRTSEAAEERLWIEVVHAVVDDVPDPDAIYEELFDWFARPDAWRQFDDVPRLLQQLVGLQVDVALASNFDRRLHSVCNGLPDLKRIRTRVVSSEVGFRKPSIEFYNGLADACGRAPEEILMVGDTFTNDVEGARAAGFHAVLIDRATQPDREAGRISSLDQVPELLSRD